jgi:stage II sporulation SpoAA-like protein
MPISYTISREQRRINAFATGTIRADDLHGLIRSLLADPNLIPGLRALYDASSAEPDITVLQLAEVAGEVRELLKRGLGRIAIVATSGATYRVAKTFTVLAQAIGIDVDVFEELSEAEAWLDENGGPWTTDEMLLPR